MSGTEAQVAPAPSLMASAKIIGSFLVCIVAALAFTAQTFEGERNDIESKLSEKYGVEIKMLTRSTGTESRPTLYTLDGQKTSCFYRSKDTSLSCTGDGVTFAEIERVR